MNKPVVTFLVFRDGAEELGGIKAEGRGSLIGTIKAEMRPVGVSGANGSQKSAEAATHTLTERLFTMARRGDVLSGGRDVYDVVAVEETLWQIPYSTIYVRKRERRA